MTDNHNTSQVLVALAALLLNGVNLSYDIDCHARNYQCDYTFDAVGITATSTSTNSVLVGQISIHAQST